MRIVRSPAPQLLDFSRLWGHESSWRAVEKMLGSPVGASPTRQTWPLRPGALGATAEATKPWGGVRDNCTAWRCSESAGRITSERRARLESIDVGADPPPTRKAA